MALRTRAMEQDMAEVLDTALRGDTPALGTDTIALIGSGTGRERGVLGRGSSTGRGVGVGGGMRSSGELRRGSIMMRGTERETGRGLGSLRERGSVKGSLEHRKPGSRRNQEKEREQSQEGREKEEKGRGKEDENSLRITKYTKYSKIAATHLQKLLKICHFI